MSIKNFLESTVRETIALQEKLINTPRARVNSQIRQDIFNFIDYCGWLLRGKSQRNITIKL